MGEGAQLSSLADTLEVILDQVRRVFNPTGCAFLIVDRERAQIEPAAAWFSSPAVGEAMSLVLRRPYDPERPGLTEAAVEAGVPLVLRDVERWSGAAALQARLLEHLGQPRADIAWAWYRESCFVACPVGGSGGEELGVLALAMGPERRVGEDELRAVHALADLAGIALERSHLLDREGARAREEVLLREAAREMAASLELDAVYAAIVEHAQRLTAASGIVLQRLEPTGNALRVVAAAGADAAVDAVVALDAAARSQAHALRSRGPQREGDRLHVPLGLGPRAFGVLTAIGADAEMERRLEALAPLAAGAIANALDYQQERRVARALARGFVPVAQPELSALEVGVLYEPAELEGGGGDFFGVWPLAGGGTAVLVGDVSGKGLEVSAMSAMVRFFVEARVWDSVRPARALDQVNALLASRGSEGHFATAFLGILAGDCLRYANAGHVPPLLRRRDGALVELPATGIPLGVEPDARWGDEEVAWQPGDLLVAPTDGLIEARRDNEMLGEARLRDLVAAEGGRLSPQALVARAHALALEWAGRVRDDMVVLAVRRR